MHTMHAPETLLAALRKGHRFLLTSHRNPDGDAIGSELALARILRTLGKGAVIWNRDPLPSLYAPLPGSDLIHSGEDAPAGFPESFDAAVVLECPTLDRTGLETPISDVELINVDHHLGNQHYAAINWVETGAPAVGALVYQIGRGLHAGIDDTAATLLFLTLMTDTGGFRFANATATAFEVAAHLVRDGARPQQVAQWIYESRPAAAIRLLGALLQTLQLHDGGRIATVHLTSEMFAAAGAGPADSEGLIDTPRSIAGVEAVALLRALNGDRFKVSLRSRGETNVEELARRHGGGGHRNAAGFELEGDLETCRDAVVAELKRALA